MPAECKTQKGGRRDQRIEFPGWHTGGRQKSCAGLFRPQLAAQLLFGWKLIPAPCLFSPPGRARSQLCQRRPSATLAHSRPAGCGCAQAGSIQRAATYALCVVLQLVGALAGCCSLQLFPLPRAASAQQRFFADWLRLMEVQLHPGR
jgi:hypothetical protein